MRIAVDAEHHRQMRNVDQATTKSLNYKWKDYDQSALTEPGAQFLLYAYLALEKTPA